MMKRAWIALLVFSLATGSWARDPKPANSKAPLTADELAIYKSFLQSFDDDPKAVFNVANRTVVLSLDRELNPDCLKGLELQAKNEVHLLQSDFEKLPHVRLVDPKKQRQRIKENDPGTAIKNGTYSENSVSRAFDTGVMTLSEIAFDKTGRYAVVSFSFVCGGLCGHGATMVFEKMNGRWQMSKRTCSSWIS